MVLRRGGVFTLGTGAGGGGIGGVETGVDTTLGAVTGGETGPGGELKEGRRTRAGATGTGVLR